MDIRLLKTIHENANRIFNSEASWETKYELIFSDAISEKVFRELRLDYYDPDTTYEEDVTAFMNAFNQKMEDILKATDDSLLM
jgi:hypothetical protein